MLGRPKTVSGDAKRTTIQLNPDVNFALSLIENSRRSRKAKRYQPSQIIEDAVWFYLEQIEGKTREQLTSLLPVPPKASPQSNVTEFRKKDKKS